MKQTEILYEPARVMRIGVNTKNKEVVIAADFSCFAYILEEYISYGVISIIMPTSSPEASILREMPNLLRKRIKLVDDSKELDLVGRLLFGIRQEFGVSLVEETGGLVFPEEFPKDLRKQIRSVHADVKRLAFGFNHNVQVEIDIEEFCTTLFQLRKRISDPNSRSILSQLEGISRYYESVSFGAQVPSSHTPKELVSIFDQLINDQGYLNFSNSVAQLSSPTTREKALVDLRKYSQKAISNKFATAGWDYLVKILKVWTGVPLPETRELSTLISGRTLPPLVNMESAKKRAVEMWMASNNTMKPLRRDGNPIKEDLIEWLPPLPSTELTKPNGYGLVGKTSELLEALNKALMMIDNNHKDSG